jgi:hypothetical protein
VISLNGEWKFLLDEHDRGIAAGWQRSLPANAESMPVPAVWNVRYPEYAGVAWYQKDVDIPREWKGKTIRLAFDALNYAAKVWIDGQQAGEFESGYLPRFVDVGAQVTPGATHTVVVRVVSPPLCTENKFFQYCRIPTGEPVDGLRLEELPSAKQTMYAPFGGIWQDVRLEGRPPLSIEDCVVTTDIRTGEVFLALRLDNRAGAREEATLWVEIGLAGRARENGVNGKYHLSLEQGSCTEKYRLWVPDHRLWSLTAPNLYLLRVHLKASSGTDRLEEIFGFREFSVRSGRFHLNGAPVFVKGVLFQPFYPITLAYPEDETVLEKSVDTAKTAGFNLLRVHISPAHRKLLELCDRKGLLIYQEPSIGWIKDSPQMERRCLEACAGLLQRDKNHPSIVAWGILNESGNFNYEKGAKRIAEKLFRFVHEQDPTRLVIDDSGGVHWSGEASQFFNPNVVEPDRYIDIHPYHSVPLSGDWFRYFQGLGSPDGKLNFISEFGFGGLMDLDQAVSVYENRGLTNLQDFRPLQQVHRIVQEGIERFGLRELFPSTRQFCLACQDVQARANCRIIEAMRSNPSVSGYCLTQFQDTSIEMGAGIVDYFYGPKKILGPIREAQSSPIAVIATNKDCYSPEEEPQGEVFLIREQDTEGEGTLRIEAADPEGKICWRKELGIRIAGGFVQSVFRGPLGSTAGTGKRMVRAVLKARCGHGHFEAFGMHDFHVFQECSLSEAPGSECELIEMHDMFQRRLANLGLRALDFRPGHGQGLIILPPLTNSFAAYPLDSIRRALERVARGATLLIFELPIDAHQVEDNPLKEVLGEGFTMNAAEGIFLGAFHWYRESGFFQGIGEGGLMDERFSNTHPVITMSEARGRSWAGTFTMWPTLVWGSDLVTVDYKDGKVLVCQLRVMEHLERDVLARHLFKNILEFGSRA